METTIELVGEWTDAQRQAARAAVRVMTDVVNDETPNGFLARIAQAPFAPTRFQRDDGSYGQVTASEVAEIIRTGKEWGGPGDGRIALQVRLEPGWCNMFGCTMGYVVRPKPLITTNSKWFNGQLRNRGAIVDAVSIAAHWMHEWMHVAGFEHGRKNAADVPYMVGRVFAEAARQRMQAAGEGVAEQASWGDAYLDALELELKADLEE